MEKQIHFSEEALFRQITENNAAALGQLYIRLAQVVYKRCLKIVKIEMDAEDLMQQAFLQLWEKRSLLATANDPQRYFWVIVRNIIYAYLRDAENRTNVVVKVASLQPCSTAPYTGMFRKEAHQQVHNGIQQLSGQQQRVISLRYEEGLSYKETASVMNVAPETVKHHIKNAHSYLRDHLGALDTQLS